MGEYAKHNGHEIKIGTCENMYYLRWDDRHRIQRLPGSVDPAQYPEGLRFRIPWPDEDSNGPGSYEPFRSQLLPDFEPEGDMPPGTYQLHHAETGLLLNVDCHHGRQLPDTGPGVRAHWNGRPPHWFRLPSTGIKCCPDGRLLPIVQCRGCGEMWRLDDWGPVLAAVTDPLLHDRLEAYSRVGLEPAGELAPGLKTPAHAVAIAPRSMTYPLTTTLNRIWACDPCSECKQLALQAAGKTAPDDEPISYAAIAEAVGLDDALWFMQAEPQHSRKWRLFAVWCARQVQHLMTDQRSIDALDVAERFANGEATAQDLTAAKNAAWDAAWGASDAAWDAAWAAVRNAASDAAWGARAAARGARAAARGARGAASAAARDDQLRAFVQLVTTGELPWPTQIPAPHPTAPPAMSAITEHITKAADCAAMTWDDLRAACRHATPLEQLHLEHLLKLATDAEHAIARFRDAINA